MGRHADSELLMARRGAQIRCCSWRGTHFRICVPYRTHFRN